MRRTMILGMVLIAAATGAAAWTGGAIAAKQNLVLREGGEHPYEGLDPAIPVGAFVETTVEAAGFGGCGTTRPIVGELTANSTKTDAVFFSSSSENLEHAPCHDEYDGEKDTMTVILSEFTLSTKGKAKLKMSLSVETHNSFGPCGYSFSIKKATFPVPAPGQAGQAVLKGTTHSSGQHSTKQCKVKEETAFTIILADNAGFPLETTLDS